MTTFILENETLHLEFTRETGALVGLTAVESGWEILNRPELGLSYRLLLPLSKRRNNPVYGEKQKVTSIEVSDDQRSARFIWDGVESEFGGSHDIQLVLDVELKDRQVRFAMDIDNRSELIVENVYSPYLGDVKHPQDETWFKTLLWNIWGVDEWSLWPTYDSLRGYFGINSPCQLAPVPLPRSSGDFLDPVPPFILLRGEKQGLYIGCGSASTELLTWYTELNPGFTSHMTGHVPTEPTIAGKAVATRFATVHLPYILPGERRSLTPIVMEAFQGDWHVGAEIYRSMRNQWMDRAESPAWTKEPHAWYEFCLNSPEGEMRMPFRDLPVIAEECVRNGIKAIQLNGWNVDGQDGGYPYQDPDPALGTKEELQEAIAKIQAMGVKVVLFTKFVWADRTIDAFQDHLIQYTAKDPYGDYYVHPGYAHQTITQLMGITQRRMVPMCFSSEEYLQLCEEEFRKMLDLGADGILIDECLHHTPALLCFDMNHGHRYGVSIHENDRELIHRFKKLLPPDKQDYLLVGEAPYDWEFEVYEMAYVRTALTSHTPMMRFLNPDVPIMAAVPGFDDRHLINQCLMYRYVVSYEPYNFKGRLADFPDTLEYGKKMDALRTELRDTLWDGLFCHEVGAKVTVEGRPHQPYSVFVNRETGKRGIVVSNYDQEKAITVIVALDDGKPLERYRLVDDTQWKPVEGGFVLPARSAAVVLE